MTDVEREQHTGILASRLIVSADYGVIYVGIQYLVYFSGVKMTPVFGGRTNRTRELHGQKHGRLTCPANSSLSGVIFTPEKSANISTQMQYRDTHSKSRQLA